MTSLLVVEDEASSRQVLVEYLGGQGYRARGAADGVDALELARDLEPDVLLCDWLLPGELSGLDVALTLRARFAHMPIIIMSGLPVEMVREGIGELRVVDVLAKPVSLARVCRAIEQALANSAPRGTPRVPG